VIRFRNFSGSPVDNGGRFYSQVTLGNSLVTFRPQLRRLWFSLFAVCVNPDGTG
jgi:hypothetical protein